MKTILKLFISTLSVLLVAYLLPGVNIQTFFAAFAVAVVLGLLNIVLRPVMIILTLPVTVFSLGLFLLVINASIVLLADWLVPGFEVGGFWRAVVFSLLTSIFSWFLNRWQ